VGKRGINASGSEHGPVAGSFVHGSETLGSVKGREYLEH